MSGLADVTREQVLDQIEACRTLGTAHYLSETGYGRSTGWSLRYKGRSYPSKAILGNAAGLRPRDFFGGIAQAVPALRALGFEIRRGVRRIENVGLAALALEHAQDSEPLPVDVAAYFHSGSNRACEIRGLANVGCDVGVAYPELTATGKQALLELAGTDVQAFVDSGAFSEVAPNAAGQLEVVRPLTTEHWERYMVDATALARGLGSQLWIVAPDRVGCGEETLRRLARWADDLRYIHNLGARVLLPVQDLTVSWWHRVVAVLGFEPIPALPCKKNATTAEQLRRWTFTIRPNHVHLLGLGPRSRTVRAMLAAALENVQTVSLDSCWITANVGRAGKPRRYTRARDLATVLLGAACTPALVAELGLMIAHGAAGVVL